MKKEVYHGDNHNTKKLDPKLMNNGNNEIGVGISFGSLDVAKTYGKDIVKTTIDTRYFVNARDSYFDCNSLESLEKLLIDLHKIDPEKFYYDLSDWGVEVQEVSDIDKTMLKKLASYLKDEEIRNLQISLAEKFGVENFVKLWNKYHKEDGTYLDRGNGEIWYAIINCDIKLQKI